MPEPIYDNLTQGAEGVRVTPPLLTDITGQDAGGLLAYDPGHGGMVLAYFKSDGASDVNWTYDAAQDLWVATLHAGVKASLRPLNALPAEADYNVGSIVDVNGELWELVADSDDRNVYRGVAGQRGTNYVGDGTFEWAPTAENIALMRALLPRSALGASPATSIYFRFIAGNGYELRNIQLTRNSSRDTATQWAYDSPTTGDRIAEIPIGTRFTVWFYTDSALTTPLTVNSGDRWERKEERAPTVPNASNTQRGTISGAEYQLFHDPYTVASPITKQTVAGRPQIGLDHSQLDDLTIGTALSDHTFTFQTHNTLPVKQVPTAPFNMPVTGMLYFRVTDGARVTRAWMAAEDLRGLTAQAAPTGVAANDTVAETDSAAEIYLHDVRQTVQTFDKLLLMRSAANTLIYASSFPTALRVEIFQPGGTASGMGPSGQQFAGGITTPFQRYFERWYAPATSPSGNQGITWNGAAYNLMGWSIPQTAGAQPASGYVLWRVLYTFSPAPGSTQGWSATQIALEPSENWIFSASQNPTPTQYLTAPPAAGGYGWYFDSTTGLWQGPVRFGGRSAGWNLFHSQVHRPTAHENVLRQSFIGFDLSAYPAYRINHHLVVNNLHYFEWDHVLQGWSTTAPYEVSPRGDTNGTLRAMMERIGNQGKLYVSHMQDSALVPEDAANVTDRLSYNAEFQRASGDSTTNNATSFVIHHPSTWMANGRYHLATNLYRWSG